MSDGAKQREGLQLAASAAYGQESPKLLSPLKKATCSARGTLFMVSKQTTNWTSDQERATHKQLLIAQALK